MSHPPRRPPDLLPSTAPTIAGLQHAWRLQQAANASNNATGNTSGPTQARGQQPASMQDLFSTIFSSMQQAQMEHHIHATGGTFVMGGGRAARPVNQFDLLTAILNPGGSTGTAEDADWSQEAFDRILEQLAEQGNNAPPPGSEDAIRVSDAPPQSDILQETQHLIDGSHASSRPVRPGDTSNNSTMTKAPIQGNHSQGIAHYTNTEERQLNEVLQEYYDSQTSHPPRFRPSSRRERLASLASPFYSSVSDDEDEDIRDTTSQGMLPTHATSTRPLIQFPRNMSPGLSSSPNYSFVDNGEENIPPPRTQPMRIDPPSPAYSLTSPSFTPTSPTYSPTSPMYAPRSPTSPPAGFMFPIGPPNVPTYSDSDGDSIVGVPVSAATRPGPFLVPRRVWSSVEDADTADVAQDYVGYSRSGEQFSFNLLANVAGPIQPNLVSARDSRFISRYTTHTWLTSASTSPSDATVTITNEPFPSTTIPLIRYDANPEKDTNCSICHEEYQEGDIMAVLRCRGMHRFHLDCIRPWHEGRGRLNCPFCRDQLRLHEPLLGPG